MSACRSPLSNNKVYHSNTDVEYRSSQIPFKFVELPTPMKVHTTNYKNTFIQVAEDCPSAKAELPPNKGDSKSIAEMQYEIIINNPYQFSSDEVLFRVYAERKGITEKEYEKERIAFFSKGQPCFRASPLPKRYGWGVHNNNDEKIALIPLGSETYEKLSMDQSLKVVKAMKTSR